jgi:hypothetical protein
MNKLFYGITMLLALVSCTSSTKDPVEYVKVELINPTANPLIASIYNNDGWFVKDTVPPFTSVIDSVEVGSYSIGVKGPNDSFVYFPTENPNRISDTAHFEMVPDSAGGNKKLRYKFVKRSFKQSYAGRYAFDLTLDSTNRYAVADIRFMYGVKDKKEYYKEFMKTTSDGKKFVSVVYKGNGPMVFPEHTTKTFDDFPESMRTFYNTKYLMPYIFPIPKEVEPKEVLNYLVKEYVILKEE